MGYNKNWLIDPVHLNDQLDLVIFFLTHSSKFVQILKGLTRFPKFIFT